MHQFYKMHVKNVNQIGLHLSGGLDSSIIANLMKKEKSHAMTIITKDFVGTDLTFAQIMAKHLGFPCH